MMYSQRDPKYQETRLGTTTIPKDGCAVMSLATLFQRDPLEVLALGTFNSRGEMDIRKTIEALGGKLTYRGQKKPIGWCMAKTDHFKPYSPTHFFPLNDAQCIDPLDYPARRKDNSYRITEYLWIEGVKLDFTREDLEKRLKIAEAALRRTHGLRHNSVVRFLMRGKEILSNLLSL